jgi:hypothetical protein
MPGAVAKALVTAGLAALMTDIVMLLVLLLNILKVVYCYYSLVCLFACLGYR